MILKNDKYTSLFNIEGAFEEDIRDAVNHGCFVGNLAYRLANVMHFNKEFCELVADAGMLHDIGKLRLDDGLYNKSEDMLKMEEMKYIRMHPTLGYELLCEHRVGNNELRQAVYHHHENYDGSGYPDNIKGEEIPLGARIIRICDVYSALVSVRPYREAYDKNTAVELMIDEVKNFDMRLFLGFMQLIHEDNFYEIDQMAAELNREGGFGPSDDEITMPKMKGRYI